MVAQWLHTTGRLAERENAMSATGTMTKDAPRADEHGDESIVHLQAEWEAWQTFQNRVAVVCGRLPRVTGPVIQDHLIGIAAQRNTGLQDFPPRYSAVVDFTLPGMDGHPEQTRPVFIDAWPVADFSTLLAVMLERGHSTRLGLSLDLRACALELDEFLPESMPADAPDTVGEGVVNLLKARFDRLVRRIPFTRASDSSRQPCLR